MIFCTLNNLLKENEVTQSKLSERTGITRPTLLQLIRNENQSIRYETIDQICSFFDIEMEQLLIRSTFDIQYVSTASDLQDYIDNRNGNLINILKIGVTFEIDDIELIFQGEFMDTKEAIKEYEVNGLQLTAYITTEKYKQLMEHKNFKKIFDEYVKVFEINEIITKTLKLPNKYNNIWNFDFKIVEGENISYWYEQADMFIRSLNDQQKDILKKLIENNHTDK